MMVTKLFYFVWCLCCFRQIAQHVNSGAFSSIQEIFQYGSSKASTPNVCEKENKQGCSNLTGDTDSKRSSSHNPPSSPQQQQQQQQQQQNPQRMFLSLVFLAHKQNAHKLNKQDIILHNKKGDVKIELKARSND
jgi:hypothetical protein